MTDGAISIIEQSLQKAKDQLTFGQKKFSDVQEGLFDHAGEIRPRISLELAQRTVEIDAIQERIKKLQKHLDHAKEDFPRREAERKRAKDLTTEAEAMDHQAASLLEQLRKTEKGAQQLRSEANKALDLSSMTLQVLEARAAAEEAATVKADKQERERLVSAFGSAKNEFENAQKRKSPEETIERLRKVYEMTEKEMLAYA